VSAVKRRSRQHRRWSSGKIGRGSKQKPVARLAAAANWRASAGDLIDLPIDRQSHVRQLAARMVLAARSITACDSALPWQRA